MAYPSMGEDGLTKRELMAMHFMAASVSTDFGDAIDLSEHAGYAVMAANWLIRALNDEV